MVDFRWEVLLMAAGVGPVRCQRMAVLCFLMERVQTHRRNIHRLLEVDPAAAAFVFPVLAFLLGFDVGY